MSYTTLAPMRYLVDLVMAGIPQPTEPWEELPERVPEVRELLSEDRAERRDPLRNLWLNQMVSEVYEGGNPSGESRAFFRGKPLLDATLKHRGMDLFPQVAPGDVRRSCEAFYAPGGWLLLWSPSHGSGKTTFALWHILRHLRIMAEKRADDDIRCTAFERSLYRCPTVVFESWPRSVGEIKAQIGRTHKDATLARLRAADILVLEDIGQMTPWEGCLLEELLNSRYAGQQRTIIATRATPRFQQIEEDILGKRILGLARQRGAIVELSGGGFRQPEGQSSVSTPF